MSITSTTPLSTDDFYLTGPPIQSYIFKVEDARTTLNINTNLQVNLTDVKILERLNLNSDEHTMVL